MYRYYESILSPLILEKGVSSKRSALIGWVPKGKEEKFRSFSAIFLQLVASLLCSQQLQNTEFLTSLLVCLRFCFMSIDLLCADAVTGGT